MLTDAPKTEYIKLHRNIPVIPENNENLPTNDQNDSKSINSTKSVNLADTKSKDVISKPKVAANLKSNVDSPMKLLDITSLKEPTVENEDNDDSTKLSYQPELEATSVLLTEQLSSRHDSDFGEAECGDPTVTRQLRFDFTISQDDTEFVQQKCSDFWKFINSNPCLQHLMVIPDHDEEVEENVLDESVSKASPSVSTLQSTAVDFLQNNDEKAAKRRSKKQLSTIETQPPGRRSPSLLANLCSELDAWDLQHQPLDPPGSVPCSCIPQLAAQPLVHSPSPSLKTPGEPVCTSDMMCLSCSLSSEDKLQLEKEDLKVEVAAEE